MCVCVCVCILINAYSLSHPAQGNYIRQTQPVAARQRGRERETERESGVETDWRLSYTELLAALLDASCASALPCPATPWDRPSSSAATGPDVSFVALIEIIAKMQMEWTTVDTGY